MVHKETAALLEEIRKNKGFRPTEFERKFLQDLSFYVTFDNIKISEKQSRVLQEIYRKSQGG